MRDSVPIRDVVGQLGLRIVGNTLHCWRPENHQHGDRTASVGLQQRRNRVKCFVCDGRSLSPIDLVMSVNGLDFLSAVHWFTLHYQVPAAPKGKHIAHQERWPERFRVGTGPPGEMLVRSGIWASLTPAQRSILRVLETFADPRTHEVTISYRGMMRYAGVRSQSTVSSAIKRFRAYVSFASKPAGITKDFVRAALTGSILIIPIFSNSRAIVSEDRQSKSSKSESLGKAPDEIGEQREYYR